MNKIYKDNKGTALLVALLVMGVLISIGLSLSTLIVRELSITKDFLSAGKSYYAAESGIEMALYGLNTELPGWQITEDSDGDGYPDYKEYSVFEDIKGSYALDNRCKSYPCLEGYDASLLGDGGYFRGFYDVLDQNESIQIPLFIADNQAGEEPKQVRGFTVEFYAAFEKNDLNFNLESIPSWDILRWKLYGIKTYGGNEKITESISDFTAFALIKAGEDDETINTNSIKPSWFGSKRCDDINERDTDEIKCVLYHFSGYTTGITEGQIAQSFTGVCPNTTAREYYEYSGSDLESRKLESEDIHYCYSIDEFLKDHQFNYLTLTNLINPSVFKSTVGKIDLASRIYFRIEFDDAGPGGSSAGPDSTNQVVRSIADITAKGSSGDTKQSINVQIKRGSFMPVFNFSLYSTYTKKEHDCEYWQADGECEKKPNENEE